MQIHTHMHTYTESRACASLPSTLGRLYLGGPPNDLSCGGTWLVSTVLPSWGRLQRPINMTSAMDRQSRSLPTLGHGLQERTTMKGRGGTEQCTTAVFPPMPLLPQLLEGAVVGAVEGLKGQQEKLLLTGQVEPLHPQWVEGVERHFGIPPRPA